MSTQRARYAVAVKAYADGTPFIAFEPFDANMPHLEGKLVSLDLKPGTTPEKAEAIARLLNEIVEGLSITLIGQPN